MKLNREREGNAKKLNLKQTKQTKKESFSLQLLLIIY